MSQYKFNLYRYATGIGSSNLDIKDITGKFVTLEPYQYIIDKMDNSIWSLINSKTKLQPILFMFAFEKYFKPDTNKVYSEVKPVLCEGWSTINNNKPYYHAWVKLEAFNSHDKIIDICYLDPTIEIAFNRTIDKINSEQYCIEREWPLEEVKDNLLLGVIGKI